MRGVGLAWGFHPKVALARLIGRPELRALEALIKSHTNNGRASESFVETPRLATAIAFAFDGVQATDPSQARWSILAWCRPCFPSWEACREAVSLAWHPVLLV